MKNILILFTLLTLPLFVIGQSQVADTTDLKLIPNVNNGKLATIVQGDYQGTYRATNVSQTPNALTIFASSARSGWYWIKISDLSKVTRVTSSSDIATLEPLENEQIIDVELGARYVVQNTELDGYSTDGEAVIQTANNKYAVLRNINGEYNVKSFGAVGDSSTNDRIAFSNAIDFCKIVKGNLFLDTGIYVWSAGLPSKSNINNITIDGRGNKIVTEDAGNVFTFQSSNNLTIKNIRYEDIHSSNTTTFLDIKGCNNLVVEGNIIVKASLISLDKTSEGIKNKRVIIRNNKVDGGDVSGNLIGVSNTENTIIEFNEIKETQFDGIKLGGSEFGELGDNTYIRNNDISWCEDDAIDLYPQSEYTHIENNYLHHSAKGTNIKENGTIDRDSARYCVFENNRVDSCTISVFIQDIQNVRVIDNFFVGGGINPFDSTLNSFSFTVNGNCRDIVIDGNIFASIPSGVNYVFILETDDSTDAPLDLKFTNNYFENLNGAIPFFSNSKSDGFRYVIFKGNIIRDNSENDDMLLQENSIAKYIIEDNFFYKRIRVNQAAGGVDSVQLIINNNNLTENTVTGTTIRLDADVNISAEGNNIQLPDRGTTSERPSLSAFNSTFFDFKGTTYFDTDLGELIVWDGDSWEPSAKTDLSGNAYLTEGDTAAMLSGYTRYVEFLDSISDLRGDISAGGIQASDTAAMLTPYISRSDTAAMLAPYSKFDGAYSSLTGKPQHEQLKTTTYITNNYTIQDSDSNKVFINNTTSNYTITIDHSATTSWSKQQIEFRAPNTGYIRISVTNGTLTDGEANVLAADTIFIGGFAYLTSGTNWTIVNGAVSGGGGGGTYSAGFGLDLATNVFSVDTTASGVATQFDIDSILSTKSYLTSTTGYIQDSLYTQSFIDSALISQAYRELNQNDTLKTADFGKILYNPDTGNDTLYIPAGITADVFSQYVRIESYSSASIVIIPSSTQFRDIENTLIDTLTVKAAAIRRVAPDKFRLLSSSEVNITASDTATAFAPFIERSDTAAMLTPYISRNDTASMLSYYYDKTEIDSALISQSSRELNQSDTLTTADFGKVVYNNDATNDTLYIPTGLTPDVISQFVGVESYGDGSVVIIEMSGVTLTDIENIAVDTTIMRATAIRCLATNSYKILSKTTGEYGWAIYNDTAYATADDSLLIPDGTTATLPIKADMTAALANNYLPFGVDSLWSQFGSNIIPTAVGATYTVRLRFKTKHSATNSYGEINFDIGGEVTPTNIVNSSTIFYPKGADTETLYSETTMLYSLDTFVTNGCKIFITADGGDIEIYDISIMIRLDSTP